MNYMCRLNCLLGVLFNGAAIVSGVAFIMAKVNHDELQAGSLMYTYMTLAFITLMTEPKFRSKFNESMRNTFNTGIFFPIWMIVILCIYALGAGIVGVVYLPMALVKNLIGLFSRS